MKKGRTVSVIGYGRFGKLLALLLRDDFDVLAFDLDSESCEELGEGSPTFVDLETALSANDIFYCVPISRFESTIAEHMQLLAGSEPKTIIDVLSVKMHAKSVLEQYLPDGFQAMLTHPMFGPDTIRAQGVVGQRIVIDRFRMKDKSYRFWKEFFTRKELKVIEMSAEEHDRLAASSQGLAHFVGRVLGEFSLEPTTIDTLGAKKLLEISNLACNDSWQLFSDLQLYNPYTRPMRVKLGEAQETVFDRLLPNRASSDKLVVGVQGGRGSFNEEAARYYLGRSSEKNVELRYLHTTENVLKSLYEGEIDRGQFAIHNSQGGIVHESIAAMARYRFEIVEEFAIKIRHCLMISPQSSLEEIESIMAHPQVFRQCRTNLEKKYSKLNLVSGEGELIDHAKVAELIASGEISSRTATMGSISLAALHGLRIIEEDLQDLHDNYTSFLWVQRPSA